jgi:hypothetical protein
MTEHMFAFEPGGAALPGYLGGRFHHSQDRFLWRIEKVLDTPQRSWLLATRSTMWIGAG